jgi:hypothetical protein
MNRGHRMIAGSTEPQNKELDRTAHGYRPARLVSGAAGQFQRSADREPE